MRVILKPRQCGKTTDLIQISAITGIPILALNRGRAVCIERRAYELGVLIPKPVVFTKTAIQPQDGRRHEIKDVLVDDADALLEEILFNKALLRPVVVSMTRSDEYSQGNDLKEW